MKETALPRGLAAMAGDAVAIPAEIAVIKLRASGDRVQRHGAAGAAVGMAIQARAGLA